MTAIQTEAPRVGSRDEWLAARKALLQQEKANMAAELQAMEDQQQAASLEQHHGDGE